MNRIRILNFLAITFSVLGAVLVVIAVALMYTSRESATVAMPPATLLVGQGVLMQGIAAVCSIVSGVLKTQTDRIEALERRLLERSSAPPARD
jgi:uncharacterized membrane protein YdbT with pleckstrin-like domain